MYKGKSICIIGLGETGVTIGALFNHHFSNNAIHVLDPSDSVAGRLLDLQHAGAYRNNQFTWNDFSAAASADIIFYCAGFRNAKEGDRLSLAKKNKDLIKTIFDSFVPSESAKIIVVTNPVELITEWISEYFDGQRITVGTGTDLDTFRLKFLLAKRLNVLPFEVNVKVIGEHGDSMVPLYDSAMIKGNKLTSLLSRNELIQLTIDLKNSAKAIRKTEEATKFGVAQCAVEIMNSFFGDQKREHIVSTQLASYYSGLAGISSAVFVSQPCFISNKGLQVRNDIVLSDEEVIQFSHSVQQLIRVENENK